MAEMSELPPDLDVAFNEASWLGVELDGQEHRLALWFDVLTLPAEPGREGSAQVTLHLSGVHRFVASLRFARWDDDTARAEQCSMLDLPDVLRSFGGASIYGWEFFDTADAVWAGWADRLSLDVEWIAGEGAHSIDLFQERGDHGTAKHLDFRAWFDGLTAYDLDGTEIPLVDLARGGRRWWDGLYAGDPRTANVGIYPLTGNVDDESGAP
jgi:hypothetical protein